MGLREVKSSEEKEEEGEGEAGKGRGVRKAMTVLLPFLSPALSEGVTGVGGVCQAALRCPTFGQLVLWLVFCRCE